MYRTRSLERKRRRPCRYRISTLSVTHAGGGVANLCISLSAAICVQNVTDILKHATSFVVCSSLQLLYTDKVAYYSK